MLEDCRLLRRDPDLFRSGRSCYRISEPLITFYQVVMRPQWGLLESGRAGAVWSDAQARFTSQVLGPHFEQLCREWALDAGAGVFGALPGTVGCVRHVERLRRARDLLAARGYDVRDTVLACYGGAGFEAGLEETADVRTVGVTELHGAYSTDSS